MGISDYQEQDHLNTKIQGQSVQGVNDKIGDSRAKAQSKNLD